MSTSTPSLCDVMVQANNKTTTENGDAAFKQLQNENERTQNLINFVTRAGTFRNSGDAGINQGNQLFVNILKQTSNLEEAYAIGSILIFQARNPRAGLGERKFGRRLINTFTEMVYDEDIARMDRFVEMIVENGRYDDLFSIKKTSKFFKRALDFIALRLNEGDKLCAKWMPRPGSRNKDVRANAKLVADYLKMNANEFQRYIARISDTVETKICAREFDHIDYSKIPSGAHLAHITSFMNNDQDRYRKYLDAISKGEAKVNVGGITPINLYHTFEKQSQRNDNNLTNLYDEMFKTLENHIGDKTVLPVIDISGSMTWNSHNGPNTPTPMQAAVSLGMYCAMKNQNEAFHNFWCSFSDNPTFSKLTTDSFITSCRDVLSSNEVGYSTDLVKVFDTLLSHSRKNNLSNDKLPDTVIMFTDMQFNEATGNYSGDDMENINGSLNVIKQKYEKYGYEVPKLVFWNLAGNSNAAIPFENSTEHNVLMCSGLSQATFGAVFGSTTMEDFLIELLEPFNKYVLYVLNGPSE